MVACFRQERAETVLRSILPPFVKGKPRGTSGNGVTEHSLSDGGMKANGAGEGEAGRNKMGCDVHFAAAAEIRWKDKTGRNKMGCKKTERTGPRREKARRAEDGNRRGRACADHGDAVREGLCQAWGGCGFRRHISVASGKKRVFRHCRFFPSERRFLPLEFPGVP